MTRNPLVMVWSTPDVTVEKFIGTDAEFTRVSMPPPTQECIDARVPLSDHCEDRDGGINLGAPEGVCDYYPQVLQKIMGNALREITQNPDVPSEFWSPAYDFLGQFKLTNYEMGDVFKLWVDRGEDIPYGSRDAVCQWVVDNLDHLSSFIPKTYPRQVEVVDPSKRSLPKVSGVFAGLAVIMTLASLAMTFLKRNTKVIYYTQAEFQNLLLFGMLLVGLGALLLSVPPSDGACSTIWWLINVGWAIQLVLLVKRMQAINQLVTSGKKMQRIRLRQATFYQFTAVAVCAAAAFVLLWQIADPSVKNFEYELTSIKNEEGATIVEAVQYCASDSDVWYIITLGWQAALVFPGSMIALMATRVKEDLNDTKSMANVLYLHTLHVALQALVFGILEDTARADMMGYQSLLISVDTIAVLGVYIIPKFFDSGDKLEGEPLPDVFPNTTIAVIEVDGFTAWSSVRQPVVVFQFIEKLHEMLSDEAEKFSVFQAEAVGETYGKRRQNLDAQRCIMYKLWYLIGVVFWCGSGCCWCP